MLPEHLEAVVHALREPAMLVSSAGRIYAANGAAREALSPPDGDIASLATNGPAFLEYLKLAARSRSPLPGALRVDSAGSPCVMKCSSGLLARAEDGRPPLVLVRFEKRNESDPFVRLSQTVEHLTEEVRRRREAEDTLRALHEENTRQGEERFQLFVESVKDYAIFKLDPTGRVASWNAGAQRIKGYSADEIVGQHFSRFYPPEDVLAGKCEHVLAVATREGRYEDESPRVRKDGSRFYANVVITAVRDGGGRLVGFIKVTRDLTEHRRHEQERIERARAEAAQRSAEANEARFRRMAEELRTARDQALLATKVKDEFLATLGHELRTPLNAIVGWSRLLQSGSVADDKKDHALGTILRNALAQNKLIDDLLDVSRIITGKFRLEVEEVDINQVASAAVDVVRPAADAKAVRLQLVFDPDAGQVLGDANRLQQVLWNLLSNAVKFTPRGGRVHVTLRRKDSHVEVVVTDTGVGIAPEFLPHVFDRFAQAEDGDVSARHSAGLGLGLAIVKHIVELHGGSAEAQSEGVGKGASFVVRLPITPVRPSVSRIEVQIGRAAPADLDLVVCPSEIEGLHVLVIDDEDDSRGVVQAVLEKCKALVNTANSTDEAFRILRAGRKPDVIVSDIGMPGEDGYVFIRRLRALPREEGGRIPAVALTAFARAEDRRKALTAGFQNHAAKPIEPQELLIVVANLAGRYL